MRQAGATVEGHADHFADNDPDDVWLSEVGKRGWIVITKDKGIRHRDNEITALKTAGVAAFVFTGKGTGEQNGAVLAQALAKMTRFVIGNRAPFIAAVSASGRIKMLYRGHKPRKRKQRR